MLKLAGGTILVLFVVFFGYARSRDLVFGVKIKNLNLTDGMTATEEILEVSGQAKNASSLRVNGAAVAADRQGNFREIVALHEGYNVVQLRAEDKFGNVDEKFYKIMR